MAQVIAAHVEETATANGTTAFNLQAASDVFHRRVNTVAQVGDTLDYTARDQAGNWENGSGTYSSTNVLTRAATPEAGSNGTSPVTFSGTVIVSLILSAATISRLLAGIKVPAVTANSGTAQTLTFPASGNIAYDITLTANCTFTLAGGTAGQLQVITLIVRGGAGGFTATLPSNVKWPGNTVPTVDGSANSYNEIYFRTVDAGATYSGTY